MVRWLDTEFGQKELIYSEINLDRSYENSLYKEDKAEFYLLKRRSKFTYNFFEEVTTVVSVQEWPMYENKIFKDGKFKLNYKE